MQAWDYWHLFQKGSQIQIGGSDQHGNILLGIDMIKHMLKDPANKEFGPQKNEDPDLTRPIGFTTPLLTTSSGEKFGKSAGNAVWLDPDMTPPYDLYQVSRIHPLLPPPPGRFERIVANLDCFSILCAFLTLIWNDT